MLYVVALRSFYSLLLLSFRPMLSARCLSCLSCLSVYNVGVLLPNGWMDQDKTWRRGRPRPRSHSVRCGPSSPLLKGAQPSSPIFAHVRCGQRASWIKMPLGMKVGLGSGDIVLDGDWGPISPQRKRGTVAHVYCGQTAGWIKMPLGTEPGIVPGHIVFDGDLAR